MRILGVDPGLDRTGYGVVDPHPQRPASRGASGHRLQPAPEDLYSYYKTPQPAILMGHVRGIILETAARMDLPVASYLPTRIKQAVVGQGHATKLQVARLVQVRLGLKETQVPADVTDALAGAGSTAWIFHKRGYILVDKAKTGEEKLMGAAGSGAPPPASSGPQQNNG